MEEKKSKEKLDEWAKESVPILQKYGYLNNEDEINWLPIIIIGIVWLGTLGVFYYAGANDFFKSETFQNVTLEPQIDVNSNPTNNYQFTPQTENKYNTTIYNNIILPSCQNQS